MGYQGAVVNDVSGELLQAGAHLVLFDADDLDGDHLLGLLVGGPVHPAELALTDGRLEAIVFNLLAHCSIITDKNTQQRRKAAIIIKISTLHSAGCGNLMGLVALFYTNMDFIMMPGPAETASLPAAAATAPGRNLAALCPSTCFRATGAFFLFFGRAGNALGG